MGAGGGEHTRPLALLSSVAVEVEALGRTAGGCSSELEGGELKSITAESLSSLDSERPGKRPLSLQPQSAQGSQRDASHLSGPSMMAREWC